MNQQLPTRDRFEKMVADLIKPADVLLGGLQPKGMALIHSGLGIAGELGELSPTLKRLIHDGGDDETRENLLEESGDFLFYVIDLRRIFDFNLRPSLVGLTLSPEYDPVEAVGRIVDTVKRIAIYNTAEEKLNLGRVELDLADLELWLDHEMNCAGVGGIEEAMTAVLWKLREGPNARYPDGYSDEAAQARRDKQPT